MLSFGMCLVVLCNGASALELYFNAAAIPGGDGSVSYPAARLEGLPDLLRQARAGDGVKDKTIVVNISGGTFVLQQPIVLRRDDVGAGIALVLRGSGDGGARISGAIALGTVDSARSVSAGDTRFAPAAAPNIRVVDVPELGRTWTPAFDLSRNPHSKVEKIGPPELIVGGAPATLARWPNAGWSKIASVGDERRGGTAGVVFSGQTGGSRVDSAGERWVRGYFRWDWYDEAFPAQFVGGSEPGVLLGGEPVYGLKAGGRFMVLNDPADLDTAGEYYIDYEKGRVYLWPPASEESQALELSKLEKPLLLIDDLSDVTITGIEFTGGRSHAIEVRGGRAVSIERCVVAGVGDSGIVIQGGRNHSVQDSVVRDVGTTGIVARGGDRRRLTPSEHLIAHNLIERPGRRIAAGHPAISIDGVGVRVVANIMREMPHAAVTFPGNDHVIEFNDVSGMCSEASDCGGIYVGRDWTAQGSHVRFNFVHDAPGAYADASIMGVYLDDLASNVTVQSNLIAAVFRGVLIGGGRDNNVSNNYFFKVRVPVSLDARGTTWAQRFIANEGILVRKLKAMPYRGGEWKARYPHLVDILADQPSVPKRNRITANVLDAGGELAINPIGLMTGTVGDNQTLVDEGARDADPMRRAARRQAEVAALLPHWQALPFDEWRARLASQTR